MGFRPDLVSRVDYQEKYIPRRT
ncbi:hypothetical protein [Pseudescherichia vulneris]